MRISKPHHTETIRVDLADTDASGSMHFIAGLRYAERAETGMRRRLGILSDWVDYPMRGVEASYDVIPRFDDELEVRLRLESVGRTSLKWAWEIVRGADTCIQGRHTAVHVDSEFRPQPFPPEVRAALESVLGA